MTPEEQLQKQFDKINADYGIGLARINRDSRIMYAAIVFVVLASIFGPLLWSHR